LEMTLLVKVSLTLSIVANFQNGDQQKTSNIKFQLQRPSNKKNYITLDFRDSTLTYAQESIFSQTNHRASV